MRQPVLYIAVAILVVATGILLLACIIGSLVIAKKEKEDNK